MLSILLIMKYRRLAGTDLDVSVLCFGPMRSAAKEPGEDSISASGEAALRAAIDAGVNFIHSSYEYGTRWMLDRVLKDHPKRSSLHHVIKVPVPDFKDGDRFDASKFRLRVEEALTDLHTDRIDILQWMWRSDPNSDERRVPLLSRIIDEVAETFSRMKKEGKVGYLMTFPYTVACAEAAIDTGAFSGLIAYYNLAEMEMADLFQKLTDRDMGFLCIRPLYQGILTDQRANRANLAPGDRFADAQFDSDYAILSKIQNAFADEIGQSLTSFAVRAVLASPVIASIIVGMNTPEQVHGLVAATEQDFFSVEVIEKARALWRTY